MMSTLLMLSEVGKIACQAIQLAKDAGVHNQLLDMAESFCSKDLPDVQKFASGDALQIGSAAVDVAAQIKAALQK